MRRPVRRRARDCCDDEERRKPQGAEPPRSEAEVARLLEEAGFEPPLRFFASLFWGAWLTRRASVTPRAP